MGVLSNNQYFGLFLGGVAPYRIDKDDGAVTGKAFDALLVKTPVVLTTLTDSEDDDMLTYCNIETNVDEIEADMLITPKNDRTIKAVTVKSDNGGVVWGLTKPDTD